MAHMLVYTVLYVEHGVGNGFGSVDGSVGFGRFGRTAAAAAAATQRRPRWNSGFENAVCSHHHSHKVNRVQSHIDIRTLYVRLRIKRTRNKRPGTAPRSVEVRRLGERGILLQRQRLY